MLIHPENSAMIGKVALFLDVYPEYKCETYRFRFPESENTKMKKKKKLSLAGQIFIALILAIIAGLLMQSHAEFAENYIKPFGTIFLNLLKFIVVPIVLFSIMSGIISMSDIKKVGSIGLKTVIYYFCTTAFAITFGLLFGNFFKNAFPVVATTDLSYEVTEAPSLMDTIVNIFPSNFIAPMSESNMLQVIVMALIFGFSIILIGSEKNSRLVTAINDLNEVFMKSMELILKLSPIGVFCLLCPVIAANGSNIIASLAMVLLTAYLCYVIHVVVIYFPGSQGHRRIKPTEVLQRHASGNDVCLLQFFFRGNTSDQPGMCGRTWCFQRDFFFCSAAGCNHQYGRYSHLSGCLCDLHRFLLRHHTDADPDAHRCSDSHTGFHRYCRCSRCRYGHAGHGPDFRWSAG